MSIEFKRGRRADTTCAERMVYMSRCGRYKLERCRSLFGKKITRWYAMHFREDLDIWDMAVFMKTYRTRKAATKALEKIK